MNVFVASALFRGIAQVADGGGVGAHQRRPENTSGLLPPGEA
jgi:hypothetical protein